jgi:HSP20 family protein
MGSNYKDAGFGPSLDDIMRAAREFAEKMKEMGSEMGPFGFDSCFEGFFNRGFDGRREQWRSYSFPPANVYASPDGSMVLEFALAGIDEGSVSVSFQGDDLVLSAKAAEREGASEAGGFSRHGFKPRDIVRQKYRVSAEDYRQDQAKAVFKSGVLTVTIPPKAVESEGIKIEIVKEGD